MNAKVLSARSPHRDFPRVKIADVSGDGVSAGLVLCSALFVVGCIVGVAAAGILSPDESLRAYLLAPPDAAFLQRLFSGAKYPLIALFFAFSALGVVGVPALGAVRGFFLCFTMSGFVRVFGAPGIPLALALVLPGAIISVPCLFIISEQAFKSSAQLLRACVGTARSAPPFAGRFVPRVFGCAILLVFSALAESMWIPTLAAHLASRLS
jgi:uncharacterized membrane protein SpoIIM required for sporulation